GGFPGRELYYNSPTGPKGGAVVRVIHAGDRVYVTCVAGDLVDPDSGPARKFHDAYKISYTPSKPSAPTTPDPVATRPPAARPRPKPPAAPVEPPPSDAPWTTVRADTGATIEMPGEPKVTTPAPGEDDQVTTNKRYTFTRTDPKGFREVYVLNVA